MLNLIQHLRKSRTYDTLKQGWQIETALIDLPSDQFFSGTHGSCEDYKVIRNLLDILYPFDNFFDPLFLLWRIHEAIEPQRAQRRILFLIWREIPSNQNRPLKDGFLVTPAKAGVQNLSKILDSCFRRNDRRICFGAFSTCWKVCPLGQDFFLLFF